MVFHHVKERCYQLIILHCDDIIQILPDIRKILLPGVLTAVPSAIVLTVGRVVTFPAAKDACIQFAPAGSTPITLIFGFNSFARVETPVASPPPPIVQEYILPAEVL